MSDPIPVAMAMKMPATQPGRSLERQEVKLRDGHCEASARLLPPRGCPPTNGDSGMWSEMRIVSSNGVKEFTELPRREMQVRHSQRATDRPFLD